MEIVPKPRVGGLTIIFTIDVTHNTIDYDSPQECFSILRRLKIEIRSFFSLDRHVVIIYRDFFFFNNFIWVEKSRDSWLALEVTHEFSLEQRQIRGTSGDISCPA